MNLSENVRPQAENAKQKIWRDGNCFIGYWNHYPDFQTQGYSEEEIKENLDSLLEDIESGEIPYVEIKR